MRTPIYAFPRVSTKSGQFQDDVEDNREVYEEFLATLRLRVVTASDGQDALAKALALQPSIIVLDLGLPVIDGWEVARVRCPTTWAARTTLSSKVSPCRRQQTAGPASP
jgi:response regulator receiver domain-containing protein